MFSGEIILENIVLKLCYIDYNVHFLISILNLDLGRMNLPPHFFTSNHHPNLNTAFQINPSVFLKAISQMTHAFLK